MTDGVATPSLAYKDSLLFLVIKGAREWTEVELQRKTSGVCILLTGQFLLALFMIVVTTLVHITALVKLSGLIKHSAAKLGRHIRASRIATILITMAVMSIVLLHTFEATLWAVLFLYLGEFTKFGNALYFSIVTSSTLGYGDITLTQQWRLLGSFASMGGLILFGASTAFMIELMSRLFSDELAGND